MSRRSVTVALATAALALSLVTSGAATATESTENIAGGGVGCCKL